jgi:DNA-binding LytR/AlgR family response regulator
MFIKLRLSDSGNTIYLNADQITYFTRGGGWTVIRTTDGTTREVRETPDEICALLAEAK